MIITDKSGNKFDVFRHTISTGSIRKGDFVEVQGQLARILEIARGCPSINKFGHGFTICLVETNSGQRATVRPVNTMTVWRGRKVA